MRKFGELNARGFHVESYAPDGGPQVGPAHWVALIYQDGRLVDALTVPMFHAAIPVDATDLADLDDAVNRAIEKLRPGGPSPHQTCAAHGRQFCEECHPKHD